MHRYSVGDRIELADSTSFYVYGLCDPRSHAIHYVGYTPHPQRRLHQHVLGKLMAGTPENEHAVRIWVRDILAAGRWPYMVILAVAESAAEARRLESAFIKSHGSSLINGRAWWYPVPEGHYALSAAARLLNTSSPILLKFLIALNLKPIGVPWKGCTVTAISHDQIETVRASEIYRRRRTRTPRGARSSQEPHTGGTDGDRPERRGGTVERQAQETTSETT